jgi:hypothetical protein
MTKASSYTILSEANVTTSISNREDLSAKLQNKIPARNDKDLDTLI